MHDDLFANIVILDNGKRQLVMIGLDLLGILEYHCKIIKGLIEKATGIPAKNIMISATHTHSGPNTPYLYVDAVMNEQIRNKEIKLLDKYCEFLCETVADAAIEARGKMYECRIGFGLEKVMEYSFNRRIFMKDGSIKMIFEDYKVEEIDHISEPTGAPDLHLVRIDDNAGNMKALIINYTAHPAIACGLDRLFSRDYINDMTNLIRKEFGEDITVLFTNGAEGNMVVASPERGFRSSFEECRRVGEGIGRAVVAAARTILTAADELKLAAEESIVKLPIRKVDNAMIEQAKEFLKTYTPTETIHGADPRLRALALVKLGSNKNTVCDVYVQVFQIGTYALIALPTETFLELGRKIVESWPGENAFIIGLANDYKGYIATAAAFDEGGYEVEPMEDSYLAQSAGEILVHNAVTLLQRIYYSK